jgi:hypothetical protein
VEAKDLAMSVVLVTPCTNAGVGARAALKKVLYWPLEDFQKWAKDAVHVIRELKAKLPPQSDLFWRDEAIVRLHKDGLTQSTIVERLVLAATAMKFV